MSFLRTQGEFGAIVDYLRSLGPREHRGLIWSHGEPLITNVIGYLTGVDTEPRPRSGKTRADVAMQQHIAYLMSEGQRQGHFEVVKPTKKSAIQILRLPGATEPISVTQALARKRSLERYEAEPEPEVKEAVGPLIPVSFTFRDPGPEDAEWMAELQPEPEVSDDSPIDYRKLADELLMQVLGIVAADGGQAEAFRQLRLDHEQLLGERAELERNFERALAEIRRLKASGKTVGDRISPEQLAALKGVVDRTT